MAKPQNLIGPNSQAQRFRDLDSRGIIARRLKGVSDELIESMGGEEKVSYQQRLLIDSVALRVLRVRMFISDFAERGGEMSFEAERRLSWHLNGIRQDLALLGLERRAQDVPSLAGLLNGQGGKP